MNDSSILLEVEGGSGRTTDGHMWLSDCCKSLLKFPEW